MCPSGLLAIILAGGKGSRLESPHLDKRRKSKAWLLDKAGKHTMLELNIYELLKLEEIEKVLIIFDEANESEFFNKSNLYISLQNKDIISRTSYHSDSISLDAHFTTYLRQFPKYNSTIEILREILSKLEYPPNKKFIFLFGHAPRPASLLVDLINEHTLNTQIVATVVSVTSKRLPIYIHNNEKNTEALATYLPVEPPYVSDIGTILEYESNDWLNLFAKAHKDKILHLVTTDAPGEFNYYTEYLLYLDYLENALS